LNYPEIPDSWNSATEAQRMWQQFDNGATVERCGSEGGIVLRDQEHPAGARITLERDCSNGIPFAVTCGIYGWFFHTRFLGSELEAEFPAMLEALVAILNIIPDADETDTDAKTDEISVAIGAFVSRFP